MTPGAELDPRVGLIVRASIGDVVGDEPTVEVHAADDDDAARVVAELDAVFEVDGDSTALDRLVIDRVGGTRS